MPSKTARYYSYKCLLRHVKRLSPNERSETELLVDFVTSAVNQLKNPKIADLCSGSGCIGFSLAQEIPTSTVELWELSKPAIDVLNKNKKLLGFENIKIKNFDVLSQQSWLDQSFDCIVANPPYIDASDSDLSKSVKDFEPNIALFAKAGGLEFYQFFARQLKVHLKPGGRFFAEMGWKQSEAISLIFKNQGWNVVLHPDYSKNIRFIEAFI